MTENPELKKYRKMLENLDDEKHFMLQEIDKKKNTDLYQLKVIKRKRPKLKKGDVFLVNPFENVFFFGVVLNLEIDEPDYGENLVDVCIFMDCIYSVEDCDNIPQLTVENILLPPRMVPKTYWNKGYFYNIGNVSDQCNFEYGFYDTYRRGYINCNREIITELPDILSNYGMTTMIGVANYLYKYLFINMERLQSHAKNLFIKHIEKLISRSTVCETDLEFDKQIAPFEFKAENARRYAIALYEFEEFGEFFSNCSDELACNGYDWEDLMRYFIKVNFSKVEKKFHYDSESSMFYMYCADEELLKSVALKLKEVIDKGELQRYIMEADFSDLG